MYSKQTRTFKHVNYLYDLRATLQSRSQKNNIKKKEKETDNKNGLDEFECCICLGNKFIFKTECSHFMCLECLTKLQTDSCPICRRSLENLPENIKKIMPVYSNNGDRSEEIFAENNNIIYSSSDEEYRQ